MFLINFILLVVNVVNAAIVRGLPPDQRQSLTRVPGNRVPHMVTKGPQAYIDNALNVCLWQCNTLPCTIPPAGHLNDTHREKLPYSIHYTNRCLAASNPLSYEYTIN